MEHHTGRIHPRLPSAPLNSHIIKPWHHNFTNETNSEFRLCSKFALNTAELSHLHQNGESHTGTKKKHICSTDRLIRSDSKQKSIIETEYLSAPSWSMASWLEHGHTSTSTHAHSSTSHPSPPHMSRRPLVHTPSSSCKIKQHETSASPWS